MQVDHNRELIRMFVERILDAVLPKETGAARLQQVGLFTLIYMLQADEEPVMVVARKLGVTRQHLHRVLAEKAPVSPDMALRLGKFCGNGPDLWLRLQQAYDLWHAERALRKVLAKIPTAKTRAA